MNTLKIILKEDRRHFRPGEEIVGGCVWDLPRPPHEIEVRLFWFTRGKGTEDVEVVDTVSFPNPQANEGRPFRLRLPAQPYSFSGKLVSLVWALELVAGKEACQVELVVSPTGQEILLHEAGGGMTSPR